MPTQRTIGTVLTEARVLLNDTDADNPAYRYSDATLLQAFNGAMAEARAKRPDLFLGTPIGLRSTLPLYDTGDTAVAFPLDEQFYNAFVYYVVGRTSMIDDTYADDSRAIALLNKFVSQLLKVES